MHGDYTLCPHALQQVNDTDHQGRTALHFACLGGRTSLVVRLLADNSLRCVHARDAFGYTPLMYAAMRRSAENRPSSAAGVVRALIRDGFDGASVDEKDDLGYTPLLMACRCGNWPAARVLLEEGRAETRLRDNEFWRTALDWARHATEAADRKSIARGGQRSRRTTTRGATTQDQRCTRFLMYMFPAELQEFETVHAAGGVLLPELRFNRINSDLIAKH